MLEAAIFSQGFPHVIAQSFKTSFADIFRNIHFLWCDLIYSVQTSQWEVCMKCWQSLWKLSLMKFILQLICIISSNPQPSLDTPFSQVSHLTPIPLVRTTSKTSLLQTHQKHLFLNSEPQVDKSKEFHNQGLKVNRNFRCYILILPSKNNKKQTSSAWNYQGFISLHIFC